MHLYQRDVKKLYLSYYKRSDENIFNFIEIALKYIKVIDKIAEKIESNVRQYE